MCNHGKGIKEALVNPYFDGFKSRFVLTKNNDVNPLNRNEILKLDDKSEFAVNLENPTTEENRNIKTFDLRELYNQHKDYVLEIAEKSAAYDKWTQEGIVDRFQGVLHSSEEVYNIVFGKYLSDAEHIKRPMSKFSKDILIQLGHKQ